MPTTRRRRRQEAREPLSVALRTYFETGDPEAARRAAIAAEAEDGLFDVLLRRDHARLWSEHGDAITADWIAEQPGTRPWAWWQHVAPEPCRRRLGGIGTPKHEVLAYAPQHAFGIPVAWVTPWEVEYYRGRARDAEGRRIGLAYDGQAFRGLAINPADPPRYESQAAYLKRLGLLGRDERRALGREAFTPELVHPAADETQNPDRGEEDA